MMLPPSYVLCYEPIFPNMIPDFQNFLRHDLSTATYHAIRL